MSLGLVLGWKFNHKQGIQTCDGVITAWPDALGNLPTQEQIAIWTSEYEAIPKIVMSSQDNFLIVVQEQKAIIESLTNRIAALENV